MQSEQKPLFSFTTFSLAKQNRKHQIVEGVEPAPLCSVGVQIKEGRSPHCISYIKTYLQSYLTFGHYVNWLALFVLFFSFISVHPLRGRHLIPAEAPCLQLKLGNVANVKQIKYESYRQVEKRLMMIRTEENTKTQADWNKASLTKFKVNGSIKLNIWLTFRSILPQFNKVCSTKQNIDQFFMGFCDMTLKQEVKCLHVPSV